MIVLFTTTLLLIALPLCASGEDPGTILTGVEKSARFRIRYKPGSKAEASVDRAAVMAERDLDAILRELELKQFPHTISLFLYDTVEELQKITGVPSSGYSIPLESHVPHDNDQTRFHELVHVVAEKFIERGSEPRNLFFAEGLANALLRFVHGVHVDSVASFYLHRGELPSLTEVHAMPDFYAWLQSHPGVNGYDIAGSYMRYLLDTYGAAKVRKYYKGVSPKDAFGTDIITIEKAWHARLAKVKLRPGTEALLNERAGPPSPATMNPAEAKLTEAILGPKSAWSKVDGPIELSGVKNQGDWCVVDIDRVKAGDAMVRCKLEPLSGCYGVKVQFGPRCQALLLRGQGCFVYDASTPAGADGRTQLQDKAVEIVFRRKGEKATVWIDGNLALEAKISGELGTLGVGCVGGKARATDISYRPL